MPWPHIWPFGCPVGVCSVGDSLTIRGYSIYHFLILLPNYIVDDVGPISKIVHDSTKVKFVNENFVDAMGLTSGIQKVTAIQVFVS
jgi:hypothetical protein